MNAMPMLVLNSPLHALMSSRYAVLEFTGRKSGRTFRTPIAYTREGERILITTDSNWWKNLDGGRPVRLRVRGKKVTGSPRLVTDPDEAARMLGLLTERIPSYARMAGIERHEGRVSPEELERAVTSGGRRAFEITIEGDQ